MPGQAPGTAMRTGTGKVVQGLRHAFTDTTVQVIMTHIEAILDHNMGIITTITGVAHDAQIPHTGVIATDPNMTHHIDHIIDHPHTEATDIDIHPTNHQDEIYIGCTHFPVDHKAKHSTGRMPE